MMVKSLYNILLLAEVAFSRGQTLLWYGIYPRLYLARFVVFLVITCDLFEALFTH